MKEDIIISRCRCDGLEQYTVDNDNDDKQNKSKETILNIKNIFLYDSCLLLNYKWTKFHKDFNFD